VQAAVAGASVAVAQGWRKMSDSFGWAGRRIEAAAKEQGLIAERGEGGAGGGAGGGEGLYQVPEGQLPGFGSGGGGGAGSGGGGYAALGGDLDK